MKKTEKQFVDCNLNDLGNLIVETIKQVDVKSTWDSVCTTTSRTCDAITTTSIRDVGNGCASLWDTCSGTVCGWFKSSEIELTEKDFIIEVEEKEESHV